MTKEEKKKAKMLEGKIIRLQGIINRFCKIADIAQKRGINVEVEIDCFVKSVQSNEITLIDLIKVDELPIDAAISWVQTEKRLAEINLNQLKIE